MATGAIVTALDQQGSLHRTSESYVNDLPTVHLALLTEAGSTMTLRRLNFYENGPSVNRETNLASIRTRLAPVAPGAICVPVRCGAAI
jgi:hypothetical protein